MKRGEVMTLKDAHILIVDDNPNNIQVLGNFLKKEYSKISVALNGQKEQTRSNIIRYQYA